MGGRNRFQPSALPKQLPALGLVNIGAAGTFVAHSKVSESQLRAQILQHLSFEPEIMVCAGREMIDLADAAASCSHDPLGPDLRLFVTIMAKPPSDLPKLPLCAPTAGNWEVKVMRVSGRAVLSLWRRSEKHILYPNEIVEKAFRVSGTTRSWATIEKVTRLLAAAGPR